MYPVLIVTGPRQVGKTTVLKEKYPHLRYISFDDPDILEYAVSQRGLFFKTYEPPLILDEVQYAPELFRYIKLLADERKKDGLFYMSGSQAFHLMKNVSESLAGRIGIIDILGLSLREISGNSFTRPFLPDKKYLALARQYQRPVGYKQLWEIIHQGSMPRLYTRKFKSREWMQFFRDYVRTYIERDVRALSQIGDERTFSRFLQLAAAQTGQMLNYSKLAAETGKTVATIQHWISILITSGIIFLLKPYSGNIKKRLIKTPKLYFLDTGLCSFLTGWYTAEQLQLGAMNGAIFETFVIGEIIKSYYNAGAGTEQFYYYRDKDQKEIDLIIEENNTLYPIEIKKTANPGSGDIQNFSALKNETRKSLGQGALIYPGDQELYLDKNTKAVPVTMI
jgi:predicted AAA+ superfamily ATPase